MKETIAIINQMEADGIIGKYAIGGAIGALFYTEVTNTQDVDIFISFNDVSKTDLDPMRPIFDYLRNLKYEMKGEHFSIEGWSVEFLPTVGALYDEALDQATEVEWYGVKTRVMTSEHLMAIALNTGRQKDFDRIDIFKENMLFAPKKLEDILQRHHLIEKWNALGHRLATQ
jgi:hypothetical protein